MLNLAIGMAIVGTLGLIGLVLFFVWMRKQNHAFRKNSK